LSELQKNTALSPFLNKKGSFVIGEDVGTALLVGAAFKKKNENYVIVTNNLYTAQKIYTFILNFLKEEECLLFPHDDLLRADAIAASKDLEAQRIYVLYKLLDGKKRIIITNASGTIRRLPNKKNFANAILSLKKGDNVIIDEINDSLSTLGYQRVNKINQSFQYAIRGEIIDIFSVNYANPVRIDTFYDQIQSISTFDISTQRSVNELENLLILPANEIIYTDVDLLEIEKKIHETIDKTNFSLVQDDIETLRQNVNFDIEQLRNREGTQVAYQYASLCSSINATLLDYVQDSTIVLINKNQIMESINLLKWEAKEYFDELVSNNQTINGLEYYHNEEALLSKGKHVIEINEFAKSERDFYFRLNSLSVAVNDHETLLNAIDYYKNKSFSILISLDNEAQYKTIEKILIDKNLPSTLVKEPVILKDKITITFAPIAIGFELEEEKIAVITSKEIFQSNRHESRFVGRFRSATILQNYEQLEPGDYVVHEYHGIGKFLDIKTILIDGVHRDFLHIAYRGKEELYTPLEQFQLVRKYAGREGAVPKLNSLNGKEWSKTKRKIQERIDEITDFLIDNQAKRAQIAGFSFPEDDYFQHEFESRFPYELTTDQLMALEEIKEDMQKEIPMERLLCGDVGFGKTEIAFRAAFKAINSGKMVAMLCPTTLLARQHYEVATNRFNGFGVNIGILSRLIKERDQKSTIEAINEGKIHFIIGTHRLLSDDINYDNLGLLIVDEEQRFGVIQKEKIKSLKHNVDILTLSATPIPRTLQMALVGIRGLSQINTAPHERMPIQTYVIPKREPVIKELIERELQRNGQVFFLHNRISTINTVARKLEKLVKSARVAVVHSKMEKEDIEDVMINFYDGKIDVLVCTSIIENGIDVSNANLIIVDEAANFGLAQLYQIKGRVGRSNRIAYAFLLYTPGKITETGRKRLKAIQDFAQLGSGYKIAQRDLMIRGAGDILGKEQAGFIDSVGIDMYFKMINDAIKQKKYGKKEKQDIKITNLLNIDAYIPTQYVGKSDKIEIYQEIKEIKSISDLENLKNKTRDVYGRLPEEVETLFRKKAIDIKIESNSKYIKEINEVNNFILITLGTSFNKIQRSITNLVKKLSSLATYLRLINEKNYFVIKINKIKGWFDVYERVIDEIIDLIAESKNENR
jgi:transcription-repair coupling factor (superfamily II helicase)